MGKLIRVGLVMLAIPVGTAVFSLWSAYRAAQHVPDFYAEALAAAPAAQEAAGEQFERQALKLHNQIRKTGRWEAHFSQDHINGWLASDLPEKFPGSLPRGVSEPRVAITPEEMKLAVRWQHADVMTVVSLAGDVHLTEEPNEVAVRIDHIRAGAIPIPLARFLDQIKRRAERAGFSMRWTEVDGDPVALVKLPLDTHELRGKDLVIEDLRLENETLVVTGRTENDTFHTATPLTEPQPDDPSDSSDTRQR